MQCECGHRFCFECGNDGHEPINCHHLKLWLKKSTTIDSETLSWINANTKECPKCKTHISRDGGCNHMKCANTACRFEFCWSCLGPWEPHGSSWYSCKRFDDSDGEQARDAQEGKRAALQRYLNYYNRFINHQQSLKLEKKLRTSVVVMMSEMQQYSKSDVYFLHHAVDVLFECRLFLMYSYPFAYFLRRKSAKKEKDIERSQENLGLAIEQLSELLEKSDVWKDEHLENQKKKAGSADDEDELRVIKNWAEKFLNERAENFLNVKAAFGIHDLPDLAESIVSGETEHRLPVLAELFLYNYAELFFHFYYWAKRLLHDKAERFLLFWADRRHHYWDEVYPHESVERRIHDWAVRLLDDSAQRRLHDRVVHFLYDWVVRPLHDRAERVHERRFAESILGLFALEYKDREEYRSHVTTDSFLLFLHHVSFDGKLWLHHRHWHNRAVCGFHDWAVSFLQDKGERRHNYLPERGFRNRAKHGFYHRAELFLYERAKGRHHSWAERILYDWATQVQSDEGARSRHYWAQRLLLDWAKNRRDVIRRFYEISDEMDSMQRRLGAIERVVDIDDSMYRLTVPPALIVSPVMVPPALIVSPVMVPPALIVSPVMVPPALIVSPVMVPPALIVSPVMVPPALIVSPVMVPPALIVSPVMVPPALIVSPVMVPPALIVSPVMVPPALIVSPVMVPPALIVSPVMVPPALIVSPVMVPPALIVSPVMVPPALIVSPVMVPPALIVSPVMVPPALIVSPVMVPPAIIVSPVMVPPALIVSPVMVPPALMLAPPVAIGFLNIGGAAEAEAMAHYARVAHLAIIMRRADEVNELVHQDKILFEAFSTMEDGTVYTEAGVFAAIASDITKFGLLSNFKLHRQEFLDREAHESAAKLRVLAEEMEADLCLFGLEA